MSDPLAFPATTPRHGLPLLFPGEAHGPRKLVHQKRKLTEELAWFDKHLFGTLKDENEALKKESARAALLSVSKMGEEPEVVER